MGEGDNDEILLTPPDEGPRVKGKRIKLQDIVNGVYKSLGTEGYWINSEEYLYRDQWGGISLLNAVNLTERVLMSNVTFKILSPMKFSLSFDKKYLLLTQNMKKVYRFSYTAQYSVFDIYTSETIPLSTNKNSSEWQFLQYAKFIPQGHSLIMAHNYDIYYCRGPSEDVFQVTKDAIPDVIQNGIPDWLYEEEILYSGSAIWTSSDGLFMLYGTFNDSLVDEQKFAYYGTSNTLTGNANLYPKIRSVRYPKPGSLNPIATLKIADLADPKNFRIQDIIPPAMLLKEISSEGLGWININTPPMFASNGSVYIAISPIRDGVSGLFKHLVHVNIEKKRVIPLTHGKFEVQKIVYWDEINNFIYYLGIPEFDPSQQHLYRVASTPPRIGEVLKRPECLTCTSAPKQIHSYLPTQVQSPWDDDWDDEITKPPTTTPQPKREKHQNRNITKVKKDPLPCQYYDVSFAPGDHAFAVVDCLGPEIPTSGIYRMPLELTKYKLMKPLFIVQNNTLLRQSAANIAFPQVKQFPVMISGGFKAQVRLFLPPGLREDEITRYPLILHVYSGPGTQLVKQKWNVDFNTYLSGTKDYIVAQIDGRGSSGQGYRFLYEVYQRLGSVEVSDQLEVTEYLRDNLHFIDKYRIGIWGWSYGGYMASMALASPISLFECGASIAPIVNWKQYDSAYTERYMRTPNVTDNYKGYDEGDLTKVVDQMRGKHFMLIHGTTDENVHLQQSMMLAKALTDRGILFKQQIYTDEGHDLEGVKPHLYKTMTSFFGDCFKRLVSVDARAGGANSDYDERS